MVDMINVGPKLQALFLNALETIGLKRLSLIAKTAFSIIQKTRNAHHIPILGNSLDPNLSKNPKSARSLIIRNGEFTIRNSMFKPLARIRDIRQIVVNKMSYFFKYKHHINLNQGNNIDEEFAVQTKENIDMMTGQTLTNTQYKMSCKNIKILINNLRRNDINFVQNFIENKPENNSMILAIEMGNKNIQKLAIEAQRKCIQGGSVRVARAFKKSGINIEPEEIAKATLAAFKLHTGPRVRNFNFNFITRQLCTENIVAKIEKREEKKCYYDNESINLAHYYLCPLTVWLFDIIEKANLLTFAITDSTFQTQAIGRLVTKAYNKKVKGKGKVVQLIYGIARYTIHIIHMKQMMINDSHNIINFYKDMLNKYTLEEEQEDVKLFIQKIEVFPIKNIEPFNYRIGNVVHYNSNQRE